MCLLTYSTSSALPSTRHVCKVETVTAAVPAFSADYCDAACAHFEQKHNRPAQSEDLSEIKQIIQKHITQAKLAKLNVPDDLIEEFLCDEHLPAVNAICGGVLANEMLKAVSHKGEPVNNFFFFGLSDGAGVVQRVG